LPDYAAQFRLLDAGGELVTATRRQAHELASAYTARQVAAGRTVWDTPSILPWPAWTARAWQAVTRESASSAVLLGSFATRRAWERIVAESPTGRSLLDARAAASGAAQAWTKAQDWCLDVATFAPATAEQAAFVEWSRAWLALCDERRWVDPAALVSRLEPRAADLVAAHAIARGGIGFHGFETIAPARLRLMEALRRAGLEVHELRVDVAAERIVSHAADGPDVELEAIAAWIVARLRETPRARLAVIVPDLAQRWATVRRVMDDRLQPSLLAPGAVEERPYAFAAGPRLAGYALTDAALLQLALARDRMDLLQVGRLLRSPYPRGADGEGSRRAALDAHLRRTGELRPTVERVRLAAIDERRGCPAFGALIETIRAELDGPPQRTSAEWATAFERALVAAGWHDGRALSSDEFQTEAKLHEALATFGGLERVLGPLTLDGALDEFAAVVAEVPFQPESDDAQVLFLDTLADPGLALDGLWVAGLTADRLPGAASPDPFLPPALQRDAKLPHSTSELELEQARRTVQAWQRSAREVVFSWAARDDDGERLPSPLLPAGLSAFEPAAPVPSRASQVRAASQLVAWEDSGLPSLEAGSALRGGVAVLAAQSACPFKAAVEFRLGTRPLERPRFGLDSRQRGTLAHDALAAFWSDVGSQQRLRELGHDGVTERVRAAIEQACTALPHDLRRSRVLQLERRWLERSMLALADKELERAPFEVHACEAEYTLTLGRRRVDVRVDRIDRLPDGATVLIDYKTGQGPLAPARWTGDRPDQPQLPAYAAHLPETPVAVAFGRLALAAVGFAGLSARPALLPDVKTPDQIRHEALRGRPWDSVIEEWRRVTTALMEAHARGVADVDPTDEACRYCAHAAICRIELRGVDADEPDDDDGD
jgi:ATP-dependent helicase/nuclease subunit B